MPIQVTLRNGVETKDFLAKVDKLLREGLPSLFRSLGDAYVLDVQNRIRTQDDGRWKPLSKWGRAKTGQDIPLLGAEKYVKARVTAKGLSIVGTARGWTLTQHDEGFTNELQDPSEPVDGAGRVVLKIKDGRPLNLYVEMKKKRNGTSVPVAQVFAFKPKEPGLTPPRKIWPTVEQAITTGQPIASRWLQQIVSQAGGSLTRG